MLIIESIKLALSSIWAHKTRSVLTMLGLIIGITAVVMLMSLGEGVKNDVKKTVGGLGTNIAFVLSGNIKIDGSGGAGGGISNPANLISGDILKRTDVDEIKKLQGVKTAAAMTLVPGNVKKGNTLASATVAGVDVDFKEVLTGLNLENGRFLDNSDNSKNVIIIGSSVKNTLFGSSEALGQKINVGKEEFEVTGYLSKPKSSGALGGSELDSLALMPFDTAKKFNDNQDKILRIGVKISDNFDTKTIVKSIEDNMLLRHSKDDFSVFTQEDILNSLSTILNMLTLFISAIAAISLVVGGVGIMNIMLVSVTERTREIGLRKAIGATDAAILLQFLIESIIISLLGGAISLVVVQIGNEFVKKYAGITPQITTFAWVLAIGVSVLVGIVFGLAPAIRASRKNPIEALRYE
ncbi:MAG: hypothetical protein ACD_58C00071G0002 [uncultured bacterium]|nr:MAG: hypothetical protein ACD_58C00071G0002 [uncultured bacterium]